jgi:bifunctional non-homologous end joining protein LigD
MVPDLEPMLATTGIPLRGLDGWVAEPKWDGWRARVAVDHGELTVRTRNGRVITAAVPELAPLRGQQERLLLDGELVAGAGRLEDFTGLSGRLAGHRRASQPVAFVAFDLLVNDEPIIDQPYTDRRRALEALHVPVVIMTPSYSWDDAPALLAACETPGMEGVVLKRLDSPYLPGKRTRLRWRKVKCAAWSAHATKRFPDRTRRRF